jgi:Zn-finger nucleic acid-binding protein
MLEQRTASLVELPWQPNVEAHVRACPECGTAMATVKLGSVALDRCEAHGVWFDDKELAALLKQAKHFRAAPHHEGILKTLGRLFD